MAASSHSIKPISLTTIHIKKFLLSQDGTLAGLDLGNALCKLIYQSKAAHDEDTDFYELSCAMFTKTDFEVSLDWLKAEAQLPETGNIHVTGTRVLSYQDLINQKLGLDVIFIDETSAHVKGAHFLISNLEPEEILHKSPKVAETILSDTSPLKMVCQGQEKSMSTIRESNNWPKVDPTENRPVFPVLLSIMGSDGVTTRIEADGSSSIVQFSSMGGLTFLGLARCLLETCDYNEIIELARSGTKTNVDTVLSDVVPQDFLQLKEFPADMHIFHLGKIIDNDIDKDSIKREDLARSLLSMAAHSYFFGVCTNCIFTGIPQIYVGGNFMQSGLFREEIEEARVIWGLNISYFKYLKTGHTGALGAMLHSCSPV